MLPSKRKRRLSPRLVVPLERMAPSRRSRWERWWRDAVDNGVLDLLIILSVMAAVVIYGVAITWWMPR